MPQVIEAYPSLGRELAAWFGRGLGQGVEERVKEGQAMGAFKRLRPMREAQREEELAYETKRGRSAATIKAEFDEAARAQEETQLSEVLGPVLEAYMPPSPPLAPRATADVLRAPQPYKAPARLPKAAVSPLLSFLKPPKPTATGRSETLNPYATAYRRALAETGDPRKAEAAGIAALQQASFGRVLGAQEGLQATPPVVTPSQMGDLETADVLLQQLDELEAGFDKNKHLLGGLLAGGGRAKRYSRQLFDLLQPEENDWIAKAEQLRGGQILDFFGKVVPRGETELAARMIPDINVMQPNQFRAAIQATRDRIIKGRSKLKQQLRTPRGDIGRAPIREGWVER